MLVYYHAWISLIVFGSKYVTLKEEILRVWHVSYPVCVRCKEKVKRIIQLLTLLYQETVTFYKSFFAGRVNNERPFVTTSEPNIPGRLQEEGNGKVRSYNVG